MLPISPSAESANSSSGSTPSMRAQRVGVGRRQRAAAPCRRGRRRSPSTMPVISRSAGPTASTASANGSACALGTEMSTERPSIVDSAVLAVPEPMLASSRSASSWRSVYWVLTGSFLRLWRGRGRTRLASASQSTIRAIWPSASTAPPVRAACSATSGGSGRVTSSRWPTSAVDAERERAGRRRGRSTAWLRVAALGTPPRRATASTIGSTPSRMTSIWLPATERTVWSARRTVRSIRSIGIANGRPSTSTSSAAMIASVSGRRIWAVVPWPSSDVSSTSPPSSRTVVRTASMPTPRPEMSLVTSAVEKPGWKSSSAARAASTASICVLGDQAALGRLAGDPGRGRCRGRRRGPSMTTLPPAWRAEISSVPVAGLPAATRSAGRLEAVVERVAHEVHERVAERVDHGAVELGVLADELAGRPACRAWSSRSRTSRGKRRNTASTGIIRTCMTIACRACEVRVRFCIACERPGTSASAASASTCVRCRTSSPM